MCGIIGYLGKQPATPLLLSGLQRLEYRGYDSAGVAVIDEANTLQVRKEKGKVSALREYINNHPLQGHIGIAHTRWATHGQPETRNAHPHSTGNIAIVHNGIIENHAKLKVELQQAGATFTSDTDSEVISQWLHHAVTQRSLPFRQAFSELLNVLEGAYAICAITSETPNTLYAARHGSPLVVGIADNECWIGSDTLALQGCATKGIFLHEGDYVIVSNSHIELFNRQHQPATPNIVPFLMETQAQDKAGYAHFMLKEIYEQPDIVRKTMQHYYDNATQTFNFDDVHIALDAIPAFTIIACGTSYYAAQIVSYWLEQYAAIPVCIDVASEFRYRKPVLPSNGVTMCISQSGETADTLAALRYAKQAGQHTIALVNVRSSTMAREADSVILTLAGAEIGVASSKAFTAQLTTLACLTLAIAKSRQTINSEQLDILLHGLSDVADKIEFVLEDVNSYDTLALALMYARDMLFIGRGTSYPLANEGALKMKEISYIHAEGYAAGELKHGPIALVDDGVPIIVIAPNDELFEKSASNLEETAARKGNIVLISSAKKIEEFKGNMTHHVALPECHPFHAPILYAVPLQLLAYYVALHKGADIDQPRNLAKSVTVE